MATGFEFFERDLRVATAGLEPEAINRTVAAFARQELARVIADGSASPQYERYVNGVINAPEDVYKAPGAIVYEFTNWPLVIQATLDELKKRGPRPRSGRFDSSYVVIVGGRVPVTDYGKIRPDAEAIILNTTPYNRKAETGLLGIPRGRLFQGTARVMSSRFQGAFTFVSRFLDVPSGINPMMPYRLKYGQGRKGREAGSPITYPAIIVNRVT